MLKVQSHLTSFHPLMDGAVGRRINAGCILHASPASPLANRGWAGTAEKQLVEMDVPFAA